MSIEKRGDKRTQAQSTLFIELGSYSFPVFSVSSIYVNYTPEALQAILSQYRNVLPLESYFY